MTMHVRNQCSRRWAATLRLSMQMKDSPHHSAVTSRGDAD
eukprot:CAMPEP_0117607606 /NCGR_PEP_ID=MMETSP0784-20121206/80361_1 /TAXON_ID=39447 /ORGANISM="" /LENGTH=39 /DNA_ID= /DNA_START= /DNA_END= /DNA_ORIENTATION=